MKKSEVKRHVDGKVTGRGIVYDKARQNTIVRGAQDGPSKDES